MHKQVREAEQEPQRSGKRSTVQDRDDIHGIWSTTMNRRPTHTMTHFGPLFVTALGGWMAFSLANSGTLYVVPGIIVAGLLAYGGTLVALRTQTARDLRASTDVTARATERFAMPMAAMPRNLGRFSPRPAFDGMDIAAGD
ncbi:MAG: hypothetical protein LC793_20625 [Thermomicrobia bacterium]|nr:hypothetical protein [Thermomicrobia bacterium]